MQYNGDISELDAIKRWLWLWYKIAAVEYRGDDQHHAW